MKNRKRKLTKKIIIIITTTFVMLSHFVVYQPKYKALTNVITYNNYGSFSRTNEAFGLSATTASVNLGCSSVVGELNGIYNGTVTINYSIGNGLSIANFSVIPENCHIISYSSSACTIEFYGVSNWTVTFLETQTKNVASLWEDLTIQSLTNWNMTYLERSDSAVMVNIQNRLTDLKTYTDGIEGLMATNNQLLQTIANNGGSGGSSTVNNIDINVDHIADELSLLKTSNDSILDELLGFFTDGLGQMLTIESVIDAIETTTTALTGIQTQLTSIGTTLNSINTTLGNINTAVQNIDNSIDTISWGDEWSYSGVTSDFINFVNGYNTGTNDYITFNKALNNTTYKDIYLYRLKLNGSFAGSQNLKLYLKYGNNLVDYTNNIVYMKLFSTGIELYFTLDVNQGDGIPTIYGNTYVCLKNSVNKQYVYNYSNNSLKSISSSDIEYWSLMSYFEQYKMNRSILAAIKSINMSVTNTTIQDTQTNITDYNTIYNQVSNVEQNYINEYNTNNTSLQSIINEKKGLPDNIINVSTDIETKIGQLFAVPEIKYLFALIISGCVLLALLG